MISARIPRLTREGWYFLGVLLFVVGGAVARELNLLLVVSGMMLGPLVFHARIVSLTLRGLRVERRVPRRVCAGEPLHIRVGIINLRRKLAAWLLRLQDEVRLVNGGAADGSDATRVDVIVPHVPSNDERWVSYRVHLSRRGRYSFGPVEISTRFPLGLLQAGRRLSETHELLVCPRVGRLSPEWTLLVQGEQSGHQQLRGRQGLTEGEFFGLREWRPGDSRRWVHWRTSARLNTLAVRQFEQQRQEAVAILLDLWLPPDPSVDQRVRLELAVSFAATAVTELARSGVSRMVFVAAGADAQCWSGASSPAFSDELIDQLALVAGGEGTLRPACEQLLANWPQGTPGIVISTRDSQLRRMSREFAGKSESGRRLSRLVWIDVGSETLNRYFHLGT
jgi:uncharacterized protein (DUF58 family)